MSYYMSLAFETRSVQVSPLALVPSETFDEASNSSFTMDPLEDLLFTNIERDPYYTHTQEATSQAIYTQTGALRTMALIEATFDNKMVLSPHKGSFSSMSLPSATIDKISSQRLYISELFNSSPSLGIVHLKDLRQEKPFSLSASKTEKVFFACLENCLDHHEEENLMLIDRCRHHFTARIHYLYALAMAVYRGDLTFQKLFNDILHPDGVTSCFKLIEPQIILQVGVGDSKYNLEAAHSAVFSNLYLSISYELCRSMVRYCKKDTSGDQLLKKQLTSVLQSLRFNSSVIDTIHSLVLRTKTESEIEKELKPFSIPILPFDSHLGQLLASTVKLPSYCNRLDDLMDQKRQEVLSDLNLCFQGKLSPEELLDHYCKGLNDVLDEQQLEIQSNIANYEQQLPNINRITQFLLTHQIIDQNGLIGVTSIDHFDHDDLQDLVDNMGQLLQLIKSKTMSGTMQPKESGSSPVNVLINNYFNSIFKKVVKQQLFTSISIFLNNDPTTLDSPDNFLLAIHSKELLLKLINEMEIYFSRHFTISHEFESQLFEEIKKKLISEPFKQEHAKQFYFRIQMIIKKLLEQFLMPKASKELLMDLLNTLLGFSKEVRMQIPLASQALFTNFLTIKDRQKKELFYNKQWLSLISIYKSILARSEELISLLKFQFFKELKRCREQDWRSIISTNESELADTELLLIQRLLYQKSYQIKIVQTPIFLPRANWFNHRLIYKIEAVNNNERYPSGFKISFSEPQYLKEGRVLRLFKRSLMEKFSLISENQVFRMTSESQLGVLWI